MATRAALLMRTPLGWLWAASCAGRLVACSFADSCEEARASAGFEGDAEEASTCPALRDLARALDQYFAGRPVDFSGHPVDLSARPPFQQRVLAGARRIPWGEVRSYGWLAARVGRPGGARAVGQAMAHNPIGLVIPCHRVVAAGGGLGGFGGGLALKRALLELEGVRFQGEKVVIAPGEDGVP